jgi:cytochrome c oxidase subunit 3
VAADGTATTAATVAEGGDAAKAVEPLNKSLGVFFSIYYCMTGLHAIHIIGGIIALSWIFYRSLAAQWRPDYFGPVDFVGLYWHLVDLIWIYLFPLMYLIR